jgi:adenylate kinase family enzyme
MHRIVIFGNSGSGKSTLARERAEILTCSHLDLDTVAWEEGPETPTRKPLTDSRNQIEPFLAKNENWVIEGCYSDLVALVIPFSTEVLFLNPGVETCITNCRNRPWEPHKYDSPEAQNTNLEMLIAWIEQYPQREDEFSLQAHQRLFDAYAGKKREYTSNARNE